MIAPDFLTVDDVLQAHEEQMQRYGGLEGLRDRALLESAVAVPQASFGGEFVHEDVFAMAAAYAYHIAQNQPFLDGNKRTGVAAALLFLVFNGVALKDPGSRLYDAMLAVAERQMNKAELAALLRELAGALQ
jgi:death-on-curing protein